MHAGIATPKELADRYGVNVFTVYRWKAERRLRVHVSPGGRWYAAVDPAGLALPPATPKKRNRTHGKARRALRSRQH
jgi:transposase